MSSVAGRLLGSGDGDLEVVVLGASGTHPSAGRACSGYLVRTPSTNLVLDMGNGSTTRLYEHVRVEDVDAIVLSHPHADHCVDLIGFYYALRFHPDAPLSVDVHAPPGTEEFLAQLVSSDSEARFGDVCRFHDARPGGELEVGDLRVRFFPSIHVVPAVSVRIEHDGRVVTYSGDSAGGEWLEQAARDADLFLCEASWQGSADAYPAGLHLTATGAGEVATAAGAKSLVLTHLWPANDRDTVRAEAEAAFGRRIDFAEDRDVWRVG
ncbi:MAG: MBL fold metallo-hydrolase [Nitriliruptorales bacterium]